MTLLAMDLLLILPTTLYSEYHLILRDRDDEPNHTKSAIWIGTNDLGPAAFFTDNRPNLTIIDYLDCVYEQLDVLYETGARNFIVLNIAPLNYAPEFALPEDGGVINTQYWLKEDQYSTNAYVPPHIFILYLL